MYGYSDGYYGGLALCNIDGTSEVIITSKSNNKDNNPQFNITGDKIIFSTFRDGNHEIYSIDIDGTNLINLTSNDASDIFPMVAPNN